MVSSKAVFSPVEGGEEIFQFIAWGELLISMMIPLSLTCETSFHSFRSQSCLKCSTSVDVLPGDKMFLDECVETDAAESEMRNVVVDSTDVGGSSSNLVKDQDHFMLSIGRKYLTTNSQTFSTVDEIRRVDQVLSLLWKHRKPSRLVIYFHSIPQRVWFGRKLLVGARTRLSSSTPSL